MTKTLITTFILAIAAAGCQAGPTDADKGDTNMAAKQTQPEAVSLRTIPFQTIDGQTTSLADFAGKVVLIVNVASECGYTKQYGGLEKLYRKYKDDGLVVVGFPANNFGGQEPGSNEEILKFCQSRFEVTFPMMAKVSVKGEDKHPLFVELTERSGHNGAIGWNFTKFLIDRDGKLVERFDSVVEPMSAKIVGAVKKLL